MKNFGLVLIFAAIAGAYYVFKKQSVAPGVADSGSVTPASPTLTGTAAQLSGLDLASAAPKSAPSANGQKALSAINDSDTKPAQLITVRTHHGETKPVTPAVPASAPSAATPSAAPKLAAAAAAAPKVAPAPIPTLKLSVANHHGK